MTDTSAGVPTVPAHVLDAEDSGTATETLATFAAHLQMDSIPDDVRHQAKRIVLDTLACVVGAARYPGAALTNKVLLAQGGHPEARAIPSGAWTSASSAAYINAELANTLDIDDNLLNHTHFANTAVAVPLAMAERLSATGPELIQAVVAAYEVSARVTLSLPNVIEVIGEWPDVSEHMQLAHGMGFGVFGGTAGAGNLLGLSSVQMANAFGTAGYHAPVPSATKGISKPMPMKKYAAYGQIAWASVVSALLAHAGYTGDRTVLDGPEGFWRMTGASRCDFSVLVEGLAEHWWSLETSFKMIPTCTWNQHPVRGLKLLIQERDIKPEDVDAVHVQAHAGIMRAPFAVVAPQDYLEAQMSTKWAVAMTILGVPGHLWQSAGMLANEQARGLAELVTLGEDPEARRVYYEQTGSHVAGVRRVRRCPSTVTVSARGETFVSRSDMAAGDPFPETVPSDDDLVQKLVDYGEAVVPESRLRVAADRILNLEEVDDVRPVVGLLCVDSSGAG